MKSLFFFFNMAFCKSGLLPEGLLCISNNIEIELEIEIEIEIEIDNV